MAGATAGNPLNTLAENLVKISSQPCPGSGRISGGRVSISEDPNYRGTRNLVISSSIGQGGSGGEHVWTINFTPSSTSQPNVLVHSIKSEEHSYVNTCLVLTAHGDLVKMHHGGGEVPRDAKEMKKEEALGMIGYLPKVLEGISLGQYDPKNTAKKEESKFCHPELLPMLETISAFSEENQTLAAALTVVRKEEEVGYQSLGISKPTKVSYYEVTVGGATIRVITPQGVVDCEDGRVFKESFITKILNFRAQHLFEAKSEKSSGRATLVFAGDDVVRVNTPLMKEFIQKGWDVFAFSQSGENFLHHLVTAKTTNPCFAEFLKGVDGISGYEAMIASIAKEAGLTPEDTVAYQAEAKLQLMRALHQGNMVHGATPISLMATNGRVEDLKVAFAANLVDHTAVDRGGNTAQHWAVLKFCESVADGKGGKPFDKIIVIFLENGADFTTKDMLGQNALDVLQFYKNSDQCKGDPAKLGALGAIFNKPSPVAVVTGSATHDQSPLVNVVKKTMLLFDAATTNTKDCLFTSALTSGRSGGKDFSDEKVSLSLSSTNANIFYIESKSDPKCRISIKKDPSLPPQIRFFAGGVVMGIDATDAQAPEIQGLLDRVATGLKRVSG